MKHVKLFEAWANLKKFDTLQFTVNQFEKEEDFNTDDVLTAAAWACDKLGLKSSNRLSKLGLLQGPVPGIDLTQVIEIWNSDYPFKEDYVQIADLFPNLLGWDEDLGFPVYPSVTATIYLEDLDCRFYRCPITGAGCVVFNWVWDTEQVFMLRSDLERT